MVELQIFIFHKSAIQFKHNTSHQCHTYSVQQIWENIRTHLLRNETEGLTDCPRLKKFLYIEDYRVIIQTLIRTGSVQLERSVHMYSRGRRSTGRRITTFIIILVNPSRFVEMAFRPFCSATPDGFFGLLEQIFGRLGLAHLRLRQIYFGHLSQT